MFGWAYCYKPVELKQGCFFFKDTTFFTSTLSEKKTHCFDSSYLSLCVQNDTSIILHGLYSLCLFCTWTSLNEMYSNANMGTLSFRVREAVQHFKVLRDGVGKYYLWVDKYNSVNDLIEFHKTSSVVRGQNIKLVDLGKVKIYVHIILSFLSQNVHAFFFQVSRKYPAF